MYTKELQYKLEKEQLDLVLKIEKLEAFIGSDTWIMDVEIYDKVLMRHQLHLMKECAEVLAERIGVVNGVLLNEVID